MAERPTRSGVTGLPHDHDQLVFVADADLLHRNGQDALLELEQVTLDMDAHEKWMLEQLLLTYVADSVPGETWTDGLAAGVRAVKRDRARRAAQSLADRDRETP
jgi:hypothetical protein